MKRSTSYSGALSALCHHAVLSAAISLGGVLFSAGPASAQFLPPPDNAPVFSLFAEGVQIYRSASDPAHPGAFLWQFTAPQADLYTDATETTHIATHFAGPTWKSDADGSAVVGKVLVRRPSPHPSSIPELLLTVSSHLGTGLFEPVTYIQRLDTVGGLAPASLPGGLNEEFRAPYTATYRFFAAVPEPGAVAWGLSLLAMSRVLCRRKRVSRSL